MNKFKSRIMKRLKYTVKGKSIKTLFSFTIDIFQVGLISLL